MSPQSRVWLPAVPALLVVITMTVGALLYALVQSLGYAPQYGINEFPTLDYYVGLARLPGLATSVTLTLYYAVVSTALAMVLGFLLALALVRTGRRHTWLHYLYKFPLMVPYLVGIALVIVLFGQGGLLARVVFALGWIEQPDDFVALLYSHYGWGIILVYLWKQVPYMALSMYVVLLGLPLAEQDAAILLGARRWQRWWYVVIPQIMPGIASAVLICFAFNLGAFEAPFILGGGFPDTLPVLAWRLFADPDYSQRLTGMAALVILGSLLVLSIALARMLNRQSPLWQGGSQ